MLATWQDESPEIFHKVYVTPSLWFNLGENIGVDEAGGGEGEPEEGTEGSGGKERTCKEGIRKEGWKWKTEGCLVFKCWTNGKMEGKCKVGESGKDGRNREGRKGRRMEGWEGR